MQGIYLVTDTQFLRGRPLVQVVQQAVAGGVRMVQLRDKNKSPAELIPIAKDLLAMLSPYGVPLLINDYPQVCQDSGAQGVHLGQSDISPLQARRQLGPQSIIGLSIEDKNDLLTAVALIKAYRPQDNAPPLQPLINYVAISPLFATATKTDTKKPWEWDGLSWALATLTEHHINIPVVVIGGIKPLHLPRLKSMGVSGCAVVSAILDNDNPYAAAQSLCHLWQAAPLLS